MSLNPRTRPRLRRANVPLKVFDFRLYFFETLLNDIADADNPLKCSTLSDRQMADTLDRNSVAELVAFVRFPLWRSHIVSPLSLHRSRLDDPLW